MPIDIMYYTDVHLRDNPPPSRRDNYKESIFAKLEFMAEKARSCDLTLCGGDLFDLKPWNQNSYSMVIRLMKLLKSTGVDNYILDGNHDLLADRESSISGQPIGAIIESGAAQLVRSHLIEKDGTRLVLKGFPFAESPDFSLLQLTPEELEMKKNGVKFAVVIHQYFSQKAGSIHGTPIYSYDEVAQYGYDLYFFGHYHIDQGVYVNMDGQVFVNPGSLSRGGYGDDAITRIPRLVKVSVGETIDWEYFLVPCPPGEEIFDLELKGMEKKHNEEMDKFVSALKASTLSADLEADAGEIKEETDKVLQKIEEDMEPEIITMVKDYLQKASEVLDK